MKVIHLDNWKWLEEEAIKKYPKGELMLRAGRKMAERISAKYSARKMGAVIWLGKGNNAGDAVEVGKWLTRFGWKVCWRMLDGGRNLPEDSSELLKIRWNEYLSEFENEAGRLILEEAPTSDSFSSLSFKPIVHPAAGQFEDFAVNENDSGDFVQEWIGIDGLLGLGSKGPLRGQFACRVEEINQFAQFCGAEIIALDFPTGWDGKLFVRADETLMIGAAKAELLEDGREDSVGKISIIPMPEIEQFANQNDFLPNLELVTLADVRRFLPKRLFSCHKGQAGRVAIFAGSRGMTGAAVLAGLGALQGGAGLITIFVPEEIYLPVVSQARPELMIVPVSDYSQADLSQCDVVVAGPGMGNLDPALEKFLWQKLSSFSGKFVLDAEILNLAARSNSPFPWKNLWNERSVLTPHPGEMQRIFPRENAWSRFNWARAFVQKYPTTLVLKGARSLTASLNRISINSTGGPQLASPGQGDVLAGFIGALLAYGLSPQDAAAAGVFLRGTH